MAHESARLAPRMSAFPCSRHRPVRLYSASLCPFTAPQPHGLTVLLQLRNQLVTLANDILVLLVLVVGSVRLNDTLPGDAVDGAGDATGGDEASKITINACQLHLFKHIKVRGAVGLTGRGSRR